MLTKSVGTQWLLMGLNKERHAPGVRLSLVAYLLGQGPPNVFVRGPHKLSRNNLSAGHLT